MQFPGDRRTKDLFDLAHSMTSARYLIRLDDACPVMHRERWRAFEDLFDEFSIRPIVAVIPDNADLRMVYDTHDAEFWQKVRNWQGKGWTIGLHGYSHVMRPTAARQMLPYYGRSEFSGLPYAEQAAKLRAGLELFEAHGIKAEVFAAPAHCFDETTVRAVRAETPIQVISDGVSIYPYRRHGIFWIPVQLPEFSLKPFGIWTICLHPNTCNEQTFKSLRKAIEDNRNAFIALDGVEITRRRKSMADWAFELLFWKRRQKLGKLIFNRSLVAPAHLMRQTP